MGGRRPRRARAMPALLKAWGFPGERVVRWGALTAAFSIPLYLAAGNLRADAPSADLVWLAGGLMSLLALWWWWWCGQPINWLERGGIYLAAALTLYLAQRAGAAGLWMILSDIYFALLAVTVVIAFRCARDQRFVATPLDFLVVFLAVVLPQVPGLEIGYAQDLTRLMVLFYALELVLTQLQARYDLVRAAACVLLCLPLLRLFM